jgi:hypothetical protein
LPEVNQLKATIRTPGCKGSQNMGRPCSSTLGSVKLSPLIKQRENKKVQDNYSDQIPTSTSDQSEQKDENFTGLESENTASETAASEVNFRSVMSQYEMEILTKLFPKCAQTVADVLRNRPY